MSNTTTQQHTEDNRHLNANQKIVLLSAMWLAIGAVGVAMVLNNSPGFAFLCVVVGSWTTSDFV